MAVWEKNWINAEIATKYLNLLGKFWECFIGGESEFSQSAKISWFEPVSWPLAEDTFG